MKRIFRLIDNPQLLRKTLWSLVFLGLVLRVSAVFVLNDYRNPLTVEYGIVARNLVAGKGFVGAGWLGPEAPTALNTPTYPVLLAVWLWLGGPLPFLGVELFQALLSALLVYLVGRIALYLSGDPLTSLLTAIFVASYPPLVYFCKQISPAIVSTFFTMLSFYLLLRFFEKPTCKYSVMCGLVFGISLLTEAILVLAIPGAALIAWLWWYKGDRRAVIGKLLVSVVICVLIVLPWTVRNYLVFQRVVPLKTSFGLNLWLGNNPNATGFLYTSTGTQMQDTLSVSMRHYLSTLNEAVRYEVLAREARAWIRSHPKQFLVLTIKRIGYLWWISPTYQMTTQNIVEPRYFYEARAVIQLALLLFGLGGSILASWKNRRLLTMSIWWCVAFTIPYAVSVSGNTRYRLPVEPVLIMLASFCFAVVGRWRKSRRPV
jgi:4-amino-4-deoxy-L-arabinose transferase-like glycosyltransferase